MDSGWEHLDQEMDHREQNGPAPPIERFVGADPSRQVRMHFERCAMNGEDGFTRWIGKMKFLSTNFSSLAHGSRLVLNIS
jgi:hypothetical protein